MSHTTTEGFAATRSNECTLSWNARRQLGIAASEVGHTVLGWYGGAEPIGDGLNRSHRPVRGLRAKAFVVHLEELWLVCKHLHCVCRIGCIQLLVDEPKLCAREPPPACERASSFLCIIHNGFSAKVADEC